MVLSRQQQDVLLQAGRGEIRNIALNWEMNYHTLRRMRSELRTERYEETQDRVIDEMEFFIPENAASSIPTPLAIPTPNVLVLSDLHCPYHNRAMLRRALQVTRRHYPHIKDVAIIGDIFNHAQISRHPKDAPEVDLNTEHNITAEVLRAILKYFDNAYICMGNHDIRVSRKLEQPYDLAKLIYGALGGVLPACKLHVSNLSYLYVDAPAYERRWMLGHPSKYSGQGGKTPSEIADIEHVNVVCAHNHRIGRAVSRDGRWEGVDLGHMTDPTQHFYIQSSMNTFPKWSSGFAVISDGYAETFTERFTNWRSLGCE